MPGSINFTSVIQHRFDSQSVPLPQKTTSIVQTNQGAFTDTQPIGITDTVLTTGSIGTFGVCAFENLDPVNYVDIGLTNGTVVLYFQRIQPLERWPYRLVPGIELRAKANGAPVKLQKTIYEN